MKLVQYADRNRLMVELANLLVKSLKDALRHRDRATLVVPGGTTPGPIFDAMCCADLDWNRVNIILSDERWVQPSSDRSNAAQLNKRLLVGRAAAATLIPLYAAAPQPEDVLDTLIAGITPHLPISVLLLGMGTDMHTASLFPGADRLADALAKGAPPLLALRAPGAGEPRITLSAPVLSGAADKHIVITGAQKRAALQLARTTRDPMIAPVISVWDGATVHWAP